MPGLGSLLVFLLGKDGLGIFFNLGEVDDEGRTGEYLAAGGVVVAQVVYVFGQTLGKLGVGEHEAIVAELAGDE